MPEQFSFIENRDNFSGWAFIASLVGDNTAKIIGEKHEQGKPYEIFMTIDGVEVSFLQIIKRLEEDFNFQVETKAKELLKERAGNLLESIYRIDECIKAKADELFQMFN